jgi:hypothetical protein
LSPRGNVTRVDGFGRKFLRLLRYTDRYHDRKAERLGQGSWAPHHRSRAENRRLYGSFKIFFSWLKIRSFPNRNLFLAFVKVILVSPITTKCCFHNFHSFHKSTKWCFHFNHCLCILSIVYLVIQCNS